MVSSLVKLSSPISLASVAFLFYSDVKPHIEAMAPNSRPPLTSRIRASFDGGKRSKSEITSPLHTNGFITQDPDSLRAAIDEAINSDTFQKAIAANLAKLIKPSIKSALDTIQPVVEAVYSHQLLLRKTNQSVEDILLRLDEKGVTISRRESLVQPLDPEPDGGVSTNPADEGGDVKTPTQETPDPVAGTTSKRNLSDHKQLLEDNHAKTTSALAELSSSVETSNSKIAEALEGINDVDTKLRSTSDSVEYLKSASEQSHTTMAVLQAQIDQLKEDIGQIMSAVGTDLGKNVQALGQQSGAPDTSLLDAHTTKLDAISTDLAALKGHSETVEKIDAVATELSSLKASVEAGLTSNREGFTGLGSQISTVLSTLEGHSDTLGEIKDKGPHPEILNALQQSNDSHAAHATALGEIKDRSVAAAGTEGGSPDTTAALQDLKSDLAALRENIEAGLISNNENVTSVGAKVDNVLSTIEGQKASDPGAEILAAVQQSNNSHASHTAVLEDLKSREIAPAPALDTSDLVTRMDSISETTNAHTTILDEIKAASGSHASILEELKSREIAPPANSSDNSDLTGQINNLSETLNAHTATLDEIKAASGSHSAALESHGSVLEGLKSLPTASEPAAESGSIDLAPLEAHITSIVSVLGEHGEALNEIKTHAGDHRTALETHGTALEEIKSLSKEAPSAPAVDTSALESQVAGLATTLESHTSALDEIKATGSAHKTALDGHGSTLEGLRSIGGESVSAPTNADLTGLEGHIAAIIATLETHTAALEELKTTSGAHATALEQSRSIRDGEAATSEGNTALESQINAIVATLQAHSATLEEINTANQSHASALTEIQTHSQTHSSTLDEIKTATSIHASALDDLKSPGIPPTAAMDSAGLAALEIQIGSITRTLDAQTSAIRELKPQTSQSSLPEESTEIVQAASPTDGLSNIMSTIIETLEMHTMLLNEMKEDVSAEILTTLHDLSQSQANQNNLLAEIREADLNDEILTLLHASGESHASHSSVLEELKTRSVDASGGSSSDISGVEAKIDALVAVLQEHKATLEEIKGSTIAANDLHASHTASLDELKSRSIDSVAPPATIDISGVETKIDSMIAALEEHKSALAEIKDTTSASHELHTAHGTILDGLKSTSTESPAAAIDLSGLEAQLGAITAALEEHKTTLSEVKDFNATHGASLQEIKSRSVESAPATDLSGLEAQLATISAALEDHKSILSDVKTTGLASHELHTAHAGSLDDIKARSIEPTAMTPSVDLSSLEAQISSISSSIDEVKARSVEPVSSTAPVDLSGLETQLAGLTSMLEEHKATLSEIKATSLASQDMHAAHATSLDEIKSRSIEPSPAPIDLSSLEIQLSSIAASLDEHKTMLSTIAEGSATSNASHLAHTTVLGEIKEASLASNESHSAHAAALSDIKDATSSWNEAHSANAFTLAEVKDAAFASNESHASHDTALRELKDGVAQANEAHALHTAAFTELKSVQPAAGVDLSPIEGHLTSIISTLERQSAALAEIKDTSPEILTQTKETHDLLTSHTALLDALKHASSHDDINTNISDLKSLISETHTEHSSLLKDLHASTTDSHSSLTAAIGGLALGGAAGAGITALASDSDDSSKELLTSINEKVNSLSTQVEINHTTTVTSITTLSDEIKAEIDATGTDISSSITSIKDDFSTSEKEVGGKLDGLEASVKQTGSFVVGLYEGVHLNDTGIGQLQEQLVTWVVKSQGPTGDVTPLPLIEGEKEKQTALEVPMDEGAWFKKRETKRGISPSPLREVETVSPPTESEDEGVDEEEVPSIEKVLGTGAVLGLGATAVALHKSSDESREVETSQDPVAEIRSGESEREILLSDESKEVEEAAPIEPDTAVDDSTIPEVLGDSILSEPEVRIQPKVLNETEHPAESTEIPMESETPNGSPDVSIESSEIQTETEIPIESEIQREIEPPKEPETQAEPTISTDPEVSIESDVPVEPETSDEGLQQPQEPIEESINPEGIQESIPLNSESSIELAKELDESTAQVERSDIPEAEEASAIIADEPTPESAIEGSKDIDEASE